MIKCHEIPPPKKSDYPPELENHREIVELILGNLSSELVSVRLWHFPNGWSIAKRLRSNPYMIIWCSGNGMIACNTWRLEMKAGDVVIIPRMLSHDISVSSDAVTLNLHFNSIIYNALDLVSLLGLSGKIFDADWISARAHEMIELEHQQPPGARRLQTLLLKCCLQHLVYYNVSKINLAGLDFGKLSRIKGALLAVEDGLSKPSLNVATMAKASMISEVYMRQLFDQVFGISPLQFIHRRRLDLAVHLLTSTDLRTKEIALNCGFRDEKYFHRIFKQYYLSTPGNFRKLQR